VPEEVSMPSVSVIVAALNSAATLGDCIDSVAGQQRVATELIVIDGGSSDGSKEVLEAKNASIAYWESEPDRGVYHAWNKALRRATGTWVCFLGADDRLAEATTLKTLVEAGKRQKADLVCSRVRYEASEKDGDLVIGQPWNWSKMTSFMCVAHPGLLHRRTVFERFGEFPEEYRIAGDYEFLLRLGENVPAAFVDEVSVSVGGTGLSSDISETLREMRLIQSRHPQIGPLKAALNYGKCLGERVMWRMLERLPFQVPDHPAVRAAGGLLGLHRHDYDAAAEKQVGPLRRDGEVA
jgi:glycosyltransferase involved in cell wall biosynthesis